MKRIVHAAAGGLAAIVIASFLISTILAEAFGTPEGVGAVKNWIVFPGLFVLAPLLALTGGLGNAMTGSKANGLIATKQTRMKVIAALGILVLIPSAIVLRHLAQSGSFGTAFIIIQIIEVLSGCTNFVLILMNMKDGLSISSRRIQNKSTYSKGANLY